MRLRLQKLQAEDQRPKEVQRRQGLKDGWEEITNRSDIPAIAIPVRVFLLELPGQEVFSTNAFIFQLYLSLVAFATWDLCHFSLCHCFEMRLPTLYVHLSSAAHLSELAQ